MSDETALLSAIRKRPADDTPRLVYADWLDEHGQPDWAEFIRVQVEAAGLRWNDPRWKDLAERAKQLLESQGEEWIEPVRWLSPGGKTHVAVSEPTVDGWNGGVELSWVDPHPGDFGDSAPPYQRSVEFHRGFVRRVWVEPHALAAVPAGAGVGPTPRVVVTWVPRDWREPNWIEEVWPVVRRALRRSRFSDWAFGTSYHHQYGWLPLLAAAPAVARGTCGLSLEVAGGAVVPADEVITALYPLMPELEYVSFFYGEWSPAVVRGLGRAGLNRRLRYLEYHDNTGNHSAADALRAMTGFGPWPQLLGLTLHGLEGVGPEAADLIRPGMFPALRRLAFNSRGAVPRQPVAAFFTALLDHPRLSHVEHIEYSPYPGDRNAALTALKKRCRGRFVYK